MLLAGVFVLFSRAFAVVPWMAKVVMDRHYRLVFLVSALLHFLCQGCFIALSLVVTSIDSSLLVTFTAISRYAATCGPEHLHVRLLLLVSVPTVL